jgi:hypothetical protein
VLNLRIAYAPYLTPLKLKTIRGGMVYRCRVKFEEERRQVQVGIVFVVWCGFRKHYPELYNAAGDAVDNVGQVWLNY